MNNLVMLNSDDMLANNDKTKDRLAKKSIRKDVLRILERFYKGILRYNSTQTIIDSIVEHIIKNDIDYDDADIVFFLKNAIMMAM